MESCTKVGHFYSPHMGKKKELERHYNKDCNTPCPQLIVPTKDQDFDGMLVNYVQYIKICSKLYEGWSVHNFNTSVVLGFRKKTFLAKKFVQTTIKKLYLINFYGKWSFVWEFFKFQDVVRWKCSFWLGKLFKRPIHSCLVPWATMPCLCRWSTTTSDSSKMGAPPLKMVEERQVTLQFRSLTTSRGWRSWLRRMAGGQFGSCQKKLDCIMVFGSLHSHYRSGLHLPLCPLGTARLLSEEHKENRVLLAQSFLDQAFSGGPDFLINIVTVNETWVPFFNPETKCQSMQWLPKWSRNPVKAKSGSSKKKRMLIAFFWCSRPPVPALCSIESDHQFSLLLLGL